MVGSRKFRKSRKFKGGSGDEKIDAEQFVIPVPSRWKGRLKGDRIKSVEL